MTMQENRSVDFTSRFSQGKVLHGKNRDAATHEHNEIESKLLIENILKRLINGMYVELQESIEIKTNSSVATLRAQPRSEKTSEFLDEFSKSPQRTRTY